MGQKSNDEIKYRKNKINNKREQILSEISKLESQLVITDQKLNSISSSLLYVEGKKDVLSLSKEMADEFSKLDQDLRDLTEERRRAIKKKEFLHIFLIEDPSEHKLALDSYLGNECISTLEIKNQRLKTNGATFKNIALNFSALTHKGTNQLNNFFKNFPNINNMSAAHGPSNNLNQGSRLPSNKR